MKTTTISRRWAAGLIVLTASVAAAPLAGAQPFNTRVIAEGLDHPVGIVYGGGTTIYFTEVPTPGRSGGMGGSNRVMGLDVRSNMFEEISFGEPEPVNLAIHGSGTLLWTCKSAGVILHRRPGAMVEPLLTDLNEPSGIAVRGRFLFFTEVPDAGTPSPDNTVKAFNGSKVLTLSDGEPEPVDVAVAPNGTVYWTCKSAGVILQRTRHGEISVLLDELEDPLGIAADDLGRIYFTEVPTPGQPGHMGGRNKVWRYDPNTMERRLIHEGDPEPTDVAVTPRGRFVFWTCTSAGVIVAAWE
jgi:hypothetical protein